MAETGGFKVLAEEGQWAPVLEAFGLSSHQFTNLAKLVTLHLLLDQLLSLWILSAMQPTPTTSREKQLEVIANMGFAQRLELGQASGWIPAEAVPDMREVNRVRNAVLHWHPKRQGGLAEIPEIASDELFGKLTERGFGALRRIIGAAATE